MKSRTFANPILIAAIGVAAFLAYRWYKNRQRAAAHPITIAPDAQLLRPMRIDPNLVTDAKIVV